MQIDFVKNLINDAGVAAVPGRGFFHWNCDHESYHHQYVRFAFCKSDDTLMAAALRMRKVADSNGKMGLPGSVSARQEDQTASASL
jgi:aspartate/methionine/tyrosine aminotransferase